MAIFLDLKYVDTRTFTRPKKKLFTGSDVNNTFSERKTSIDGLVLINWKCLNFKF